MIKSHLSPIPFLRLFPHLLIVDPPDVKMPTLLALRGTRSVAPFVATLEAEEVSGHST